MSAFPQLNATPAIPGIVAHADSENTDVMVDINTTPLIDVMLVLLIMLIITIPAQMHAFNLHSPSHSASVTEPPRAIDIYIDERNQIFWNKEALLNDDALSVKLAAAQMSQPPIALNIQASGQAQYATVAHVLASAQRHQIHQLAVRHLP